MYRRIRARWPGGRSGSRLLLLVFLATPAAVLAQTVGSIEGRVTDTSGGVLPGVTVLVTSEETGIARSLVTDAAGRYTLIAPGLVSVDASLVKQQSVGGTRQVEFRLEVFNLLNRANFGQPSSTLFNSRGVRNATAGRITSTVTTARQIQLALRFEF